MVHQQIFFSDLTVNSGDSITVLNSQLDKVKGKNWLMQTNDTACIRHEHPSHKSIRQLVEACAGIGAVGQGFKACGFQTVARAESNPNFCKWLTDRGHSSVVQGDVAEASVIRAIADLCDGPPTVTAGFSCQPFSNLGDRLEEKDNRSSALTSVLRLCHFLRAPVIVLECTKGAMTSNWVQMVLKKFQEDTGYHLQQQILDLHYLWPSHRTRWWAVLTAPYFEVPQIPELPSLGWSPGIIHLMPKLLDMTKDDLQQLELSPYELRYFHSMGKGIGSHIINLAKAMPTATHSWGSQVLPCHCGCRKGGFTTERLDSKGLYGILVPLGKTCKIQQDELSTFRHPHPQEIALLNGCFPSLVKPSNTSTRRLDMAGIGQLASPLQSCWISSHVLQAAFDQGLIDTPIEPISTIKQLCRELFQARNELLGVISPTTYMQIFENAIENIGTKECKSEKNLPSPVHFSQALLEEVKRAETNVETPVMAPIEMQKTHESAEEIEEELIKPVALFSVTEIKTDCQTKAESDEVHLPLHNPDPHVLDLWCEKDLCFGGVVSSDMHEATTTVENEIPDAYTGAGGVALFSTSESIEPPLKKQRIDQEDFEEEKTNGKHQQQEMHEPEVSATIPWTQEVEERQPLPLDDGEPSTPKTTIWIGQTGQTIFPISFQGSPTIGQATQAEAKLHDLPVTIKPMNGVGGDLSLSQPVENDDVVLIRQCGQCDNDKCFRIRCSHSFAPKGNGVPAFAENLSREELLWNQRGWVANDEMKFYLETLKNEGNVNTCPPLYFEDEVSQILVWGDWVVRASEIACATNQRYETCTAVWHDHHWFPVRMEIKEHEITITTTPLESDLLHSMSKETFGDYNFVIQVMDIHNKFPADCGFQAIAWLAALARNEPGSTSIEASEALKLRKQFAHHLRENNIHDTPPSGIRLGGMQQNIAQKELQALLESHGVRQHRLKEHTQHVIDRLSLGEVIKTLQSPRPWADLKAKASALKPPLQLVLAEELKIAVEARLHEGKSFGRKQNKMQSQSNPSSIRLQAAHVQVPAGLFQQTDGTKLTQITSLQINQQARGFAVVNIDEALPFFDITDPIGKAGIALMILDHQDKRIPEHCKTIRFPAQYAETDEPVIVTASLLQLGQQQVQRFVPESCAKIEEVATSVIRAMVYRDQYKDHEWNNFRDRPVKCLMEQPAFQQLPKQAVIDVWDRQFVSKTFKKARAPEADIFIVTLRVEQQFAPSLLEISGSSGIYTEPRDDAGRQPHPCYKVIWIPKASYGDLVVAKQKTEGQSWISRNGDRYGIRVEAENEKMAHQLHRPDVDYIGGDLKQFRVGPLPFGTNKSSLTKAFRQWNWEARAGQPLTQTRDHSGVFWSAKAAGNPSHWIFTMQHGDVLITPEPSREESSKPSQTIVASTRTIQHIAATGKPPSEPNHTLPMLRDDPWAPKNPVQPQKALSVSQVAAIEQNIEKRIRATLPQQPTNEDAAMDGVLDERVTQMEKQMKHMQESFGAFQTQQQAHNVQVAHELTAVRSQVDAQTTGFQQILADKLEEQMSKIDALLNKRQRNE